jgi:hypothetical protein
LGGSCIDTVPTARVQPDRLFADALSFSMVTVLSMRPGCTATTRSVVTLVAAADGLAEATIGEAVTVVRGEGDAPTDGVGTTAPDDGLAIVEGEALLLIAADGDAPIEGAVVGLGAAGCVGVVGAAVVHAAVDKMMLNPMARFVTRNICLRANANHGPPRC